ncbi:hypothetical protein K2173_026032 [Erythroxylum novogranatense]|uniref:Reverse transcriptase n=1 Tax=Erythroxylum novogranatense TaxID=1862640 RepID=A0AAV8SHV5_9ROSI|nr:hypothetical protein K2173_026032 [Erythroxylum novogranatense]
METRQKTNAEFRVEVTELIAKQEAALSKQEVALSKQEATLDKINANYDQLSSLIQTLVSDFHSFKMGPNFDSASTPIRPAPDDNFLSVGENSRGSTDIPKSSLKLSFPKFNGEDPPGWIFRAEQYFAYQGITVEQRTPLASFHLEGLALQWFRWFTKFRGPLSWTEFTRSLLQRFGPTDYEDPAEALSRLKQTTTVEAYQDAFERLSHQVDGLPESFLVGSFTAGLRDEIRLEVKLKKPRTLNDAIGAARIIEEKNQLQRRSNITPRTSTTTPKLPGSSGNGVLGPVPSQKSGIPNFRRLSFQEAKERREKGLCFYCDEKFVPGHRCVRPQLFMIEDCNEVPSEEPEEKTENEEEGEFRMPEISFHAITGVPNPQTIRVKGKLKGKEVIVLIDGGSTHNFIEQGIVTKLGLPIDTNRRFQVMIANKDRVDCAGICRGMKLLVHDCWIAADFFVLPSAACSVVLGVQWLANLGPIETDYGKLTLAFNLNSKRYTFQGLQQRELEALSDKEAHHLLSNSLLGTGFFIQLISTEVNIQDSFKLHPDIVKILGAHQNIFEKPKALPPVRDRDHRIPLLPNSKPVNVRPYRYPYYQKTEIENQVRELLASGLIRPSSSPFSSPVLLVRKANGEWRFCVDYRALNEITIKDKFPIPVIDELMDELFGARYFSKFDLRAGYHQIRVYEPDIPKTAFRTHEGHYEFVVMPFGLTNAPSTFQSLMNEVFRPFLRKFVLVFFDDILVYSKSWEEHMQHLQSVLTILSQHQFFAKEEKCVFAVERIEYLGHILTGDGIEPCSSKIQAVLDWPVPTTVRAVRGFLGLAGYYRKFIKHYGTIAAPLNRLMSKEGFIWTQEAAEAFEHLKQTLSHAPVLRLPDFSQPFVIECDASGSGIGAVLMQQNQPIAFFSEGLKGAALKYSTYEKEMLAVVKSVRKWRPYLLGNSFIVRTDHRSLKFLLEQRITTPAQARWLPKLMGYEYRIEYKKGAENTAADSLSRKAELCFVAVSTPQAVWWQQLQHECSSDPFYFSFASDPKAIKRDGVWFLGEKVLLSPSSPLIPVILAELHASAVGGHFGFHKTLARVQFIRHCDICQRNKTDHLAPAGLLQPLPIPDRIWSDVSMDFIDGLPTSGGCQVIMVVVDRLSKYAHFISMSQPCTSLSVAKAFIANIVRLHGVPSSIVSDRDRIFMSNFWSKLFEMQGTKLNMSSMVNRTLEQYLRCFTSDQPKRWKEWLPWAEYSYNTSTHSSTKVSPFQAVYGIPPPSLLRYVPRTARVEAVDSFLRERDDMLKELKITLKQARDRMKSLADQHRRDVEFEVGDYVYLKLQPYRQSSVAFRASMKLSPRFYGPFRIIARIGSVAYRLELPSGTRIHNVFHVSRLRKFLGDRPVASPDLPPSTEESPVLPQPEKVLAHRVIQKGKYRPKKEVLVKWIGASPEDATWEDTRRLQRTYPSFTLEDKGP